MKKTNNLLCFLLSFAMLVSLLTQVAFAESTNITSEADFLSALANTETTEMNITGNVSVDASIEKSIDINVKSGATLTLNFDEGENGISLLCMPTSAAMMFVQRIGMFMLDGDEVTRLMLSVKFSTKQMQAFE